VVAVDVVGVAVDDGVAFGSLSVPDVVFWVSGAFGGSLLPPHAMAEATQALKTRMETFIEGLQSWARTRAPRAGSIKRQATVAARCRA
jgi:hypothetical protein